MPLQQSPYMQIKRPEDHYNESLMNEVLAMIDDLKKLKQNWLKAIHLPQLN